MRILELKVGRDEVMNVATLTTCISYIVVCTAFALHYLTAYSRVEPERTTYEIGKVIILYKT